MIVEPGKRDVANDCGHSLQISVFLPRRILQRERRALVERTDADRPDDECAGKHAVAPGEERPCRANRIDLRAGTRRERQHDQRAQRAR
jgi:hypothetical protein